MPCNTSVVHHHSLRLGRKDAHSFAADVRVDGVEHTLHTSPHILVGFKAARREQPTVIRIDGDAYIRRQSSGNVVPIVSQGDIEEEGTEHTALRDTNTHWTRVTNGSSNAHTHSPAAEKVSDVHEKSAHFHVAHRIQVGRVC